MNTITKANMIGLTQERNDNKIMVNADHILTLEHVVHDGQQITEVFMVGGRLLWVRENMYDITERIGM